MAKAEYGVAVLRLEADPKKLRSDLDKEKAGVGQRMGSIAKVATGIAATALAGVAAASVGAAKQLEKSFAEVRTLLPDISDQAFGSMRTGLRSLQDQFAVISSDAVPALYQAISASVPPSNVLEFMEIASKASIGGITSLETAVDGLTSVVNSYGSEVISAGQVSDIMFTAVKLGKTDFDQLSRALYNVVPTAKSLGVGFDQIGAAMATMTAQGVPTKIATTTLRQLFVELAKDTKLSTRVMEVFGKSFRDLTADGLSIADVMQGVRDSMPTAEFDKLFSSVEAQGAALQITGDALGRFNEALDATKNAAGATDAAFKTMAETASFQMDQAINAAKIAMEDLGTAILPAVATVMQRVLLPAVREVTNALETVTVWVANNRGTLTGIWTAAQAIIRPVLDLLIGRLRDFWDRLVAIATWVYQTGAQVWERIKGPVTELKDAVAVLVDEALDALSAAFGGLESPGRLVGDILQNVILKYADLAAAGIEGFTTALDAVIKFVQSSAFQSTLDWLADKLEAIGGAARDLAKGLGLIESPSVPAPSIGPPLPPGFGPTMGVPTPGEPVWLQELVRSSQTARSEIDQTNQKIEESIGFWERLGRIIRGIWLGVTGFVGYFLAGISAIGVGLQWLDEQTGLVKTAILGILAAIAAKLTVVLAPAIGAVIAKIAAFVVGILAAIGPVGWIILAIVGLIAVIGYLYKNWDTLGPKAEAAWNAVKDYVADATQKVKEAAIKDWNAITKIVTDAWGRLQIAVNQDIQAIKRIVGLAWSSIRSTAVRWWGIIRRAAEKDWNALKTFFGNLWDAILTRVGQFLFSLAISLAIRFLNIATAIEATWNRIKTFFATTWRQIGATFRQRLAAIGTGLATRWEAIRLTATAAWTRIKTFFADTWTAISTTITGAWNGIGLFLGLAWTTLQAEAVNLWSSIVQFFADTWTAISTTITGAWNGIALYLGLAWTTLQLEATALWGSILQFFSDTWTAISTTFTSAWNGIALFLGLAWLTFKTEAATLWAGIIQFFVDTWTTISTTFTAAWNGIALYLGLAWTTLQAEAATLWAAVVQFFVDTWTSISTTFTSSWNAIALFLGLAWTTLQAETVALWESIKTFFGETWQSIAATFRSWLLSIQLGIALAWLNLRTATENLWNAVKQFFSDTWQSIAETFRSWLLSIQLGMGIAWALASAATRSLWNSVKQFFSDTWAAIASYIRGKLLEIRLGMSLAWALARSRVEAAWNAIKQFFSTTWTAISDTFRSMLNGIMLVLTLVWGLVKAEIELEWNRINQFFADIWAAILDTIGEKLRAIRDEMETRWTEIVGKVSGWYQTIRGKFTGQDWRGIGRSIMNGIKGGVMAAAGGIASAAANAVRNAIAAAKRAVGIHSPSRVAAVEIGVPFVEGIAEGMRQAEDAMMDRLTDMLRNPAYAVAAGRYGTRVLRPPGWRTNGAPRSAGRGGGPGTVIHVAGSLLFEKEVRKIVRKTNEESDRAGYSLGGTDSRYRVS